MKIIHFVISLIFLNITMIEVIPREHPEAHNVRIRDSVQVVVKFFYFIHLAISILYSAILLIVEKRI